MKFDNTYNLSVKYEKLSRKQTVSKVADFIGEKLNKISQSQSTEKNPEQMFYDKLSWYANMFKSNAGNDLYQFILNLVLPIIGKIDSDQEKVIRRYSKDICDLFRNKLTQEGDLESFVGLLEQCIANYADKKQIGIGGQREGYSLKNVLGKSFDNYSSAIQSLINEIINAKNGNFPQSKSTPTPSSVPQTADTGHVAGYVKEQHSYFSDPKVGEIQRLLNSRGENLKVDNVYGPQTSATLQKVLVNNSGKKYKVAPASSLNKDNSSILDTYIGVLKSLSEKGVVQAASKIELNLKKYAQSSTNQLMSRLRWFENTFADISGNSFKAFIQNEAGLKSDSRDQYFANSQLINSYVKFICDLFKNKGLVNKSSQPNVFIPEFKDFIDYIIKSSSSDKFATGGGETLTLQEFINLHNGNYDRFISILSELRNSMIGWMENNSIRSKPVFDQDSKYNGPFYSSNSVAKLQDFLGLKSDGQYGPKTYFAVNKLLREHGLRDSAMTPESLYGAANADDYIEKYIKLFENSIETLNA